MLEKSKKIIALVLSLLMLFTSVPVAFAADSSDVKVEIISFMRGAQADLRSSELLEARVTGYDGNVRELTYKWSTTLGTYLYVYNSHNMYHIRNTPGEVEIYNSKKLLPTPDMVGRYYANEFEGKGFAWAAVHSNSAYDKSQLVGLVSVEVYDKDNNLLCSDIHEGKLVDGNNTGFLNYNLQEDLDDVVIGLFEGDKRNVKDLLGESAVVHIVCVASKVMKGYIESGDEYIDLFVGDDGDYYIEAEKAGDGSEGDALVNLTVQKTSCKFHRGSYESATTTVFVFKKPTTSTTTTTLTLGNLDERCDYFIDGVQGTEIDENNDGISDKVVFENLTPNTDYVVEVRGDYTSNDDDKRYAYAFVYDTTKPAYKATVKTYLDGALTDISAIHGSDVALYLYEDKAGAEFISLDKSDIGIYTAAVENGVYYPWHIEAGDHYHQAREYKLIIENANGELSLHHYSVIYDTNGGSFKEGEEVSKEIFSSGASVTATNNVPVKEGYIFSGWDYNGVSVTSGGSVTSSITAPVVLKAKWEKAVNVTINVTIDHKVDGGYDYNDNRDELTVEFLEQKEGSPAFIETGDKLFFSKEGVTDENGNPKSYDYIPDIKGDAVLETKYTATAVTYEGLSESSYFGVSLSKSGYDVGEIEKIKDENGNWTINIPLSYNPSDFDLEFSVKMDEDVPKELYPDAVIIKIACWDKDAEEWVIITQQRTTENKVRPGVRVDIDKTTGEGAGSYPVWKHDADNNPYGYRAVVAGFIYKDSTIVVPTEKDHIKDENKVIITYTDGNYTATMGDIADGNNYGSSLNGAYYNVDTDAQQGTLDGIITVEKYDVTFDAQGGTINNKDTDIVEDQYYVPDLDAYVPVMENHSFLGWYLDEECTVPATEGELLTDDITVYAKWDKILTGTVIVDGYYDSTHIVDKADRTTYALVELKEITSDGTYNVAGQTVEINWTDGKHFSDAASYEFKGLDPDKNFRVDVFLVNYDAVYQNSTTVINGNGDIHDDYNEDDYTAVYPENSKTETFVNIFLHFEPEEYIQNVEIDATRLGEGFRPENALVKYYSQEIGTASDYVLIVQHKGENDGVHVGMNTVTGTNDGEYGEKVWKENFNGNLYNYQADLVLLGGKDVEQWPVSVVYGDPARWSPYNQSSTGPLKVIIVPKRYEIIYDWNDGTGHKEADPRSHTWSYETVLDTEIIPEHKGFNFLGWVDENGNDITSIAADVASDTTVYAKWERKTTPVEPLDNVSYIVEHYKENADGTYSIVEKDTEILAGKIGSTVTATAKAYEGYCLNEAKSEATASGVLKAISSASDILTLKLYYDIDTVGGGEEGEDGDGTPDKYQKKVIFKVVNGTWSDGTATDKVVYVDLMKDGQYAADGSASLTAPTGMKANDGFKNGSWDVTPPATVSGTETLVFTYSFIRSTTPVEPLDDVSYIVEHYKENAEGTYSLAEEDTEILAGKIGDEVTAEIKTYEGYDYNEAASVTSGILKKITTDDDIVVLKLYYVIDKTVTYKVEHYLDDSFMPYHDDTFTAEIDDKVKGQPIDIEGYAYNEYKSFYEATVEGDGLVLKLYYEPDTKGGENGGGDGIPDKYQKKVIFVVENGTWADGSKENIEIMLELKTDGKWNESAQVELPVPEGMKADEGFGNGKWVLGKDMPTHVGGTITETFTYRFKEIKEPENPGTPDNPDNPDTPDTPDTPGEDGGNGNADAETKHYVVFGKTDGIGWYNVSKDGGQTFDIVFGNSHYEVEEGTELIIKVGDLMGDNFVFYVNGDKYQPDENGQLVVTVKGYMLIGAISVVPEIDFEVPDTEESLNWLQKIIKAIRDFFDKLFGWMK